jgi:hypothetical protein
MYVQSAGGRFHGTTKSYLLSPQQWTICGTGALGADGRRPRERHSLGVSVQRPLPYRAVRPIQRPGAEGSAAAPPPHHHPAHEQPASARLPGVESPAGPPCRGNARLKLKGMQ